MKIAKSMKQTAIALALCAQGAFSFAADPLPIKFAPGGTGPGVELGMLDWLPGNALAVNGNPSGGLQVDGKIVLLSHGKLGVIVDSLGNLVAVPGGIEITFVAGFKEKVVTPGPSAAFLFDDSPGGPNYFEMWTSTIDSNPLLGTNYNNGKLIMTGVVIDSSGNYSATPKLPVKLDQFGADDWAGVTTITGSGSTQLAGNIVWADPNYFPGLTQDQIDNIKIFFNSSTVTPYKQTNPSRKFVNYSDPAAIAPYSLVLANIGTVNGGPHTGDPLNFIFQADANQRFEQGEVVEGTCRVTYGGNDPNGNANPNKFGKDPECHADPNFGNNCYTFGGQAGAPTADNTNGGPFGNHTHHQKSGDAGDFTFKSDPHDGINKIVCKDPGAIKQAVANAKFKQIDFEGVGSFSFPKNADGDQAQAYLAHKNGDSPIDPKGTYYFRVDMVDSGEPGNQFNPDSAVIAQCAKFLNDDQNNPLATPDPLLLDYVASGADCPDVYQILICPTDQPCDTPMYAVRGFLTGGNVQIHKVVK